MYKPSTLTFSFPGASVDKVKASFPTTGKTHESYRYPMGEPSGQTVETTRSTANWPTFPIETAGFENQTEIKRKR